jgi:hypothetical protein
MEAVFKSKTFTLKPFSSAFQDNKTVPSNEITWEQLNVSQSTEFPGAKIVIRCLHDVKEQRVHLKCVVTRKSSVFWDITPGRAVKLNWCFGGIRRLYFHNPSKKPACSRFWCHSDPQNYSKLSNYFTWPRLTGFLFLQRCRSKRATHHWGGSARGMEEH